MEIRRLPEEHWTPALIKLKEEGLFKPNIQKNGCSI